MGCLLGAWNEVHMHDDMHIDISLGNETNNTITAIYVANQLCISPYHYM